MGQIYYTEQNGLSVKKKLSDTFVLCIFICCFQIKNSFLFFFLHFIASESNTWLEVCEYVCMCDWIWNTHTSTFIHMCSASMHLGKSKKAKLKEIYDESPHVKLESISCDCISSLTQCISRFSPNFSWHLMWRFCASVENWAHFFCFKFIDNCNLSAKVIEKEKRAVKRNVTRQKNCQLNL